MSRYLPPQHGAWAFLGLPVALGLVVAPWTPLLLVLALAWVVAYPWSYAALGLVRSPRPQRFRRPFAVWLAVLLPSAAVLLAFRPWLVWVGLLYGLAFLVNLGYARRNDERAVGNDLVFALECAVMVVVVWAVGAGDGGWVPPGPADVPDRVWVLALVGLLVLVGSTLHVKSLIRERRDARYARASKAFAVLSLPVACGLAAWWGLPSGWWLLGPFALLALRAFVVGRRPLRPGVIGVVELGCFIGCVLCACLAQVTS